jgi:hypothetical protein
MGETIFFPGLDNIYCVEKLLSPYSATTPESLLMLLIIQVGALSRMLVVHIRMTKKIKEI